MIYQRYNHITSLHYAAYRPPLHEVILEYYLDKKEPNLIGLDVGCGTGQSSIALAEFCEKVMAIDPSQEMIAQAKNHPKITYQNQTLEACNFASDQFDVITFAGALYYTKSQNLLDEVIRICKGNGKIIVYDFEIILDSVLEEILGKKIDITKTEYDHQANFSGLDQKSLYLERELGKETTIEEGLRDVGHLLFSDVTTLSIIKSSLSNHSFEHVITVLRERFPSGLVPLTTKIFGFGYENKM